MPQEKNSPPKYNGIEVNKALEFVRVLWDYTSLEANCYSVVLISGNVVRAKHFCLSELGNYEKLYRAIRVYLEKLKIEKDDHVYYQVLPLASKPEKGRGSAKDVKVGKWLWADLDYKEVVDKAGFEGCKEFEDHALECYYIDSDKIIHVSRPSLNQVLELVRNKLGIEPSIVVDSGAGYHLYFKLKYEIDAVTLKKLEDWLVDRLEGDPQSKDLARILRLPGSINPRVGRLVQVIYWGSEEVDPEKLLEKVETEKRETYLDLEKNSKPTILRELSDSEILRIVDLLKDAYKPGYRQFLVLYLSGWLSKARVSPISAIKIVKALYESTGDNDPLKTRLSAVVYSYKKAGIDVDEYASDIESLTGVKPYGLEKEIHEDKVRGVSGLQEILESTLGEDRALAVIHELSEILGSLSPYEDSVIELLDYEKQIYAVANLRKLVIARAKRDGSRLVYKERIAVACPTRVVVYSNPIGGVTKYEVTLEGATLKKPLVIGPATIDEITDRITIEGLVYHRRLLPDILSAIIQAFIRKGKAETKTEIEAPGFYLVGNRIVAVKPLDYQTIDISKLETALLLLDDLASVWFKHIIDKFATIIKWGIVAPYDYIIKQRGKWIHWLYLYGDSATGKTTLGKIVLRIWGLDSRNEKTGASIDTIARLGYVISQNTYPVLINEPGGALMKEEITEAIKNAVENLVVRGKHMKGSYTEIPALAPLIFTSNRHLPQDDTLLRRFRVITFSYGEKIPLDKQKEFRDKIEPKFGILSEIGKCVTKIVLENGLHDTENYLELGKSLLTQVYEIAKLQAPQWLGLEYSENVDIHSSIIEEFAERLKKYINDCFARYVNKIIEVEIDRTRYQTITPDSVLIEQKLRILLEKNMLPGVRPLDKEQVAITSSLLRELGLDGRIALKSLTEMLGWDYRSVRIGDKVTMGAITEINKIIELLTP